VTTTVRTTDRSEAMAVIIKEGFTEFAADHILDLAVTSSTGEPVYRDTVEVFWLAGQWRITITGRA
jgi:hypothetical protein